MSGYQSRLQTWIYPELARFPDDASRRAAWGELQKHAWKVLNWRLIIPLTLVIPLGLLTIGFVIFLQTWFRIESPLIRAVLFGGLIGVVQGALVGAIINRAYRKPLRRLLRQKLNSVGIPICLHCGYDTRGLTEPRCPECGRASSL